MPDLQNSSTSGLTERSRRRLNKVIVLSIVVLLLMLSLIAQSGFNLKPFVTPGTATETLLLYALSTLNFLAFVILLFVLLRNVIKLVRERRADRLGSKFKSRLVSYAIGLSLLPVLLLFFFAFGLLNRSIDRWFGEPARQIVDDARAIEESYFKKEEAELVSIARAIIRSLSLASRTDYDSDELRGRVNQEMAAYNVTLARIVTASGKRTIIGSEPGQVEGDIEETLDSAEQQLKTRGDAFSGRDEGDTPSTIYVIAGVRLTDAPDDPRLLIIAREFPPELTERAANITSQHENFHSLLGKLKRIKAIYILLLAAVTLLLLFSATWLALYVARGITIPIQALAEATDRVARGDFTQPVEVVAEDELAVLVKSFNQMSAMLAENRERLERAADDLSRTNLALDDRRRYIETVLESLSTGVVSTDENARIATINRAALWMLGLAERPATRTPIAQLTGGPEGVEIEALCRRARRSETAQAEVEFKRADGSTLHTTTTAIALRSSSGAIEGWVIVIEDLSDLVQAERAAAWSEVARRMAHEIKNPLTPIQLSAERIMRNYKPGGESRLDEIVREGTTTIIREVAALQKMVEEFSRFARLPESQPAEASLNEVVRDALTLYNDRLDGISIECDLAGDLPPMRIDTDQIKRVLVNLIDNAVEALNWDGKNGMGSVNGDNDAPGSNGSSSSDALKVIEIESRFLKETEAVRLIVTDTGHGISPRDRDKLFLPKFSTRERGTGLGLAIVSHIVADHKGRIWVEDNQPQGARFVVELPAGRAE
ncbi:MAG TPA: ATP-binding protein [Blastocatellia bacterium]|nr:ATP-binding protein [Blastocatellia bacterium]